MASTTIVLEPVKGSKYFSFEKEAERWLRLVPKDEGQTTSISVDLSSFERLELREITRLILLLADWRCKMPDATLSVIWPSRDSFGRFASSLCLLNVLRDFGILSNSWSNEILSTKSDSHYDTVPLVTIRCANAKRGQTLSSPDDAVAGLRQGIYRLANHTALSLSPEICSAFRLAATELVDNVWKHSGVAIKPNTFGIACALYYTKVAAQQDRINRSQSGPYPMYREFGTVGHLQLIVADTGLGICRAIKNRLKVDDSRTDPEQEKQVLKSVFETGVLLKKGRESLGLQMVREVVELYGGVLWCRSGFSDYQLVAGRGRSVSVKANSEPLVFLPGTIVALYVHCPTERIYQLTDDLRKSKEISQSQLALPLGGIVR